MKFANPVEALTFRLTAFFFVLIRQLLFRFIICDAIWRAEIV